MTAVQDYVPEPMEIPTTPGGRVRYARLKLRISQRALADAAGIGFGEVQGIEANRRSPDWEDSMRRIAAALVNEEGAAVRLSWLKCEDQPWERRRPVLNRRKNITDSEALSEELFDLAA